MRISILLALILSTALLQSAPRSKGSGGWGAEGKFNRMYDPQTVQSIRGEVIAIEELAPLDGMSRGIHLRVKTRDGIASVHLGPSWYLLNQDVQIRQGDQIEVTGSKVSFEGKPAIIASTVKRGNDTLELRDNQGLPLWAGWRNHQAQ